MAERGRRPDKAAAAKAPVSRGDAVAVSIHLTGAPDSARGFLRVHGAAIAHEAPDTIEAYVPVSALAGLDAAAGVGRVEAIVPPHPAQGTVTSEGVADHDAPDWQGNGYTGSGVKVGIIDVGFHGYGSLIGTELPAPAGVRCYTGIGTYTSSLSDCENGEAHGTAVAETLVDVAPEATLYLATPISQLDLQEAVNWMRSQGVQVINHSVEWAWDGPGDGTSPFLDSPLRAVDQAVSGGIVWVNAAGNDAEGSWTGPWLDPDSDGWLNFGSGGELNVFHASAGDWVTIQARWGPDSWTSAKSDIDLGLFYIPTVGEPVLVDSSTSPQQGATGDTPY
ncbi:MAG: hypothetical protein IRY97_11400, partial [Thermomicrobiaceae bacterium]|nr:hypothetical protein [Thermomicrobiaceae bacterium]